MLPNNVGQWWASFGELAPWTRAWAGSFASILLLWLGWRFDRANFGLILLLVIGTLSCLIIFRLHLIQGFTLIFTRWLASLP